MNDTPYTDKEEAVGLAMLTRFKELKRAEPNKPLPDVGWMIELLRSAKSDIQEVLLDDLFDKIEIGSWVMWNDRNWNVDEDIPIDHWEVAQVIGKEKNEHGRIIAFKDSNTHCLNINQFALCGQFKIIDRTIKL